MKVLVTGHDGYIGQVMVPLLAAAGHEVCGLDTGFYGGCQFTDRPGMQTIAKDIRDIQASDLEGFDAVAFLAALSNDALGDLDPALTVAINHEATVRCAKLAKEAGVPRFVFSSSCSLYGAGGDDLLTEEAEMHPVTPYGKAKIDVERELTRLASEEFSPTYMRNATAYGVSPSLRIDLVVNNLTGYAVTTGTVRLKSDGSPWRPLVHIEDISRAFLAVLEAPRETVHDQAYNVGRTAENFRIREVAEMVREAIPGSEVTFADGASPDTRNYRVSFEKIARQLPAFEPRWTVRTGIDELAAAYRANNLKVADLESTRYLRIKSILAHRDAGRLDDALRWRG